ncbi:hypothetical protein AKJ40_03935 [candidate division MSBL1 archaeon SCGC-AAA259M10]|uniref:Uncharacterized protein n=1 Tax=candidate division MSBL1 archaeon SCGC-AAA259M10 TaxID=1698270 RepID=A0A133UY47_9EURY|nr:hypothetical protein AKJ40_03935 [candidate division MSBL1 archaeon SCGC-AAA259M10]
MVEILVVDALCRSQEDFCEQEVEVEVPYYGRGEKTVRWNVGERGAKTFRKRYFFLPFELPPPVFLLHLLLRTLFRWIRFVGTGLEKLLPPLLLQLFNCPTIKQGFYEVHPDRLPH